MQNKPNNSALNSVVKSLLKSSLGLEPTKFDDKELDAHISSLLCKEAEQRIKQYELLGFGNFNHSNSKNGPLKTNKRFLNNIISQTERHNQILLKDEYRNFDKPPCTTLENSSVSLPRPDKKVAYNRTSLTTSSSSAKKFTGIRGRGNSNINRMDEYFSSDSEPLKHKNTQKKTKKDKKDKKIRDDKVKKKKKKITKDH
ncbi:hypothetical protein BB561_003813 [Smittium simulii]|uniref:Uncharacterized protein n=1 Tax=Smittium simulii TaxID=133385 RepID=A0A2T9YJD9_9FUNG|nr:hypothetical protein BB561_003813 [Smittium simulii]